MGDLYEAMSVACHNVGVFPPDASRLQSIEIRFGERTKQRDTAKRSFGFRHTLPQAIQHRPVLEASAAHHPCGPSARARCHVARDNLEKGSHPWGICQACPERGSGSTFAQTRTSHCDCLCFSVTEPAAAVWRKPWAGANYPMTGTYCTV